MQGLYCITIPQLYISVYCIILLVIQHPILNLQSSQAVIMFDIISYYKSIGVCLSVCLSVCSPTLPRSFDGSSPNLVGVCRWTSELPLRGSFLKRSTGQWVTFSDTILYMIADDTRLRPHRCKKHTASFALSKGICICLSTQ